MSDAARPRATRLQGSGTVPRVFGVAVLAIVSVFAAVWLSDDPSALIGGIVLVALALAVAVRSLLVGVFLEPDAVRVRGWFRDYRYRSGELTAVTAVPYWKFLDSAEPILSLLKFTPARGWVREISATVSWKDRTLSQAAEIRRHLGIAATPAS